MVALPTFWELLKRDAGNASGINDGAALCLLMSAVKEGKGLLLDAFRLWLEAQELGLQPLVFVRGFASAGVDPKIMGSLAVHVFSA